MPTDRVLIEIVTAANMAGIEQANKGMLGLNASTVGLGIALGALVFVGKSAIENTRAQEDALLGLRQATDAQGKKYEFAKTVLEGFITTNKAYISNQYDVIAAYAKAIRAGNSQTHAVRLLNDALDLSVIKHEDVSTAMQTLILAENGNGRALKELGISASEYSDIMKSKTLTDAEKHRKLLDLIESKTRGGRKAVDELQKAQNTLNTDWQNFTTKIGPPLLDLMSKIVTQVDQWYQGLVKFGEDNKTWGDIDKRLTDLATKARDLALWLGLAGTEKAIVPDKDRGSANVVTTTAAANKTTPGSGQRGGHTVIIQGGIFMDHGPTIDALANKVAQRLATVSGF